MIFGGSPDNPFPIGKKEGASIVAVIVDAVNFGFDKFNAKIPQHFCIAMSNSTAGCRFFRKSPGHYHSEWDSRDLPARLVLPDA